MGFGLVRFFLCNLKFESVFSSDVVVRLSVKFYHCNHRFGSILLFIDVVIWAFSFALISMKLLIFSSLKILFMVSYPLKSRPTATDSTTIHSIIGFWFVM